MVQNTTNDHIIIVVVINFIYSIGYYYCLNEIYFIHFIMGSYFLGIA